MRMRPPFSDPPGHERRHEPRQRFLELAFEGVRIHDFKRLRLSTGTFAWNDNRLVFPIPQRDVDASEGVIAQNPGY